jgi:hypothetical protein
MMDDVGRQSKWRRRRRTCIGRRGRSVGQPLKPRGRFITERGRVFPHSVRLSYETVVCVRHG